MARVSRNKFFKVQTFKSPLLIISMGLIYGGAIGVLLYGNYMQFVLKQPWGDKPITDGGLVILTFFIMLVLFGSAYMLFGSKLKTTITGDSISVTFEPFIKKPVVFNKSDIKRFEVRKYKPIKEYGGWGIKVGSKKHGKAYNVKGKIGLQLYLKDGSKVLIGTQRRKAITYAMKKMMGGEK